jgi:hypothetical protein
MFATRRSLKEFDDKSRHKLREAEAGYQRELEELRKKAARPGDAGGAKKAFASIEQRVLRMKQKMLESAQIIEQFKCVFKQKLTGLETLAALLQHQMKVELQSNKEEFEDRKTQNEQQFQTFEADLKTLQ